MWAAVQCVGTVRHLAALLVLCASVLATVSSDCPRKCDCTDDAVSCTGANLGTVPRHLPAGITKLDMGENRVTSLSISVISPLGGITELSFKNNEIETIADGTFLNTTALVKLDLSGNLLTFVHRATFTGASATLLTLDLSQNSLSQIDGAFAAMRKLTRLDLTENKITSLTTFTFRDLSSLRYLILGGNRISSIDGATFRRLSSLTYLVMRRNPLNSLTLRLRAATSLNYIDLSDCGVREIPARLPSSMGYLHLRGNNISQLTDSSLAGLPALTILVLDSNGITDISPDAFQSTLALQHLWLNNNELRQMPSTLPKTLLRLLLDNNHVEELRDIGDLPALQKVSLMGNAIRKIAPEAFRRLPLLTSVDISNNQLVRLEAATFSDNRQLATLQLSRNPLQQIDAGCFRGTDALRSISIAYVQTETVQMEDKMFRDLANVSKLNVDSSPAIASALLQSDIVFGGLRDLSMLSTDIKTLNENFLQQFPALETLHLSSTMWHCDSRLRWLKQWASTTRIQFDELHEIRCQTPRRLHDRKLQTLADDEFATAPTTPPTTTRVTTATTSTRVKVERTTYGETATKLPPPSTQTIHIATLKSSTSRQDKVSYRVDRNNDDDAWFTTKPTPPSGATKNNNGGSNVTLLVVLTTVITAIVAIALIIAIVHISRCRRRRKRPPPGGDTIEVRHDGNVLYFTTVPPGPDTDESTTDSIKTVGGNRDGMALLPGRDINHEGPRRVYNWEEF